MTPRSNTDYLNLSWAAYTSTGTPVALSGWTIIDKALETASGMQAVTFQNTTTLQIVIRAHRRQNSGCRQRCLRIPVCADTNAAAHKRQRARRRKTRSRGLGCHRLHALHRRAGAAKRAGPGTRSRQATRARRARTLRAAKLGNLAARTTGPLSTEQHHLLLQH